LEIEVIPGGHLVQLPARQRLGCQGNADDKRPGNQANKNFLHPILLLFLDQDPRGHSSRKSAVVVGAVKATRRCVRETPAARYTTVQMEYGARSLELSDWSF
jgi:hypothetical protein